MRILLTGGTGLIGRSLCQFWRQQGHELWVWSRNPQQVPRLCSGAQGIAQLQDLDGSLPFDAVVNLAGAPIADRRWTETRRAILWRSRVDLTRTLVHWIERQPVPPCVLISGSATGWYGDCGDQWLTEDSASRQTDFSSRLCVAWEHEAEQARQCGVRVALLRTAPVLTPQGGLLARLLPAFRWGLGGRLGEGQQWMPWIHIDDQIALIDHILRHDDCHGAFNACAPEAVRNIDFTRALARALHRPALLPVPAWALRLALGEMSVLLLGSQRLEPHRTRAAGFSWRHPTLAPALAELLHTR